METIGDRMKMLMEKFGYTQKELAEMCGVTEAAMSRYLSGERFPKADIVANLATALETTTDYLISGDESVENYENVYRLVARSKRNMSQEEKLKLIRLLTKDVE